MSTEPEWQDVKTARKFAELAGHAWEDLSESVKARLAARAADMRTVFNDAGRDIDKPPIPDSAKWWRQVAQRLAIELHELKKGATNMQPHQERVISEKAELDGKLNKLKAFIEESPTFKGLPADERGRLNKQFDAMAEYSSILSQRIAAF